MFGEYLKSIYDDQLFEHEKQGYIIDRNFNGEKYKSIRIINHEWKFIFDLYNQIIYNNEDMAKKFVVFVNQFYPHYKWKTFCDYNNPISSVSIECNNHDMIFNMIASIMLYDDKEVLKEVNFKEDLNKAMEFGEIVTDFFVRYLGFSIVGVSGQKIIITSRSDCDKKFYDHLYDGYILQRKSKVGYKKGYDISKSVAPYYDGYFYELPILPTKDIGFEFEEYFYGPNNTLLKYNEVYDLNKSLKKTR